MILYNEETENEILPGQQQTETTSGSSTQGISSNNESIDQVPAQPQTEFNRPTLNSPTMMGNSVFTGGWLRSGNFVTGVSGWSIDANGNVEFGSGYFRGDITGATGTFSGTVNVGSLNIPDLVTANSFHVDTTGNAWWGATTLAGAFASILNTGVGTFGQGANSITLDGTSGTIRSNNQTWNLHGDSTINLKFGGDGADGTIAVSSGTTTVSLGNASVVVKNYSSISVTGTGKLAFSNPAAGGTVIILKVQGNVTCTSSTIPNIDASGMGATGGNGGANNTAGTAGSNPNFVLDSLTHGGGRGTTGGASDAAGVALTQTGILPYTNNDSTSLYRRFINVIPGAGGGGGAGGGTGGTGSSTGGNGGRGGGGLYIECAGALNFTSALGISVAGANGANGGDSGGTNAGAGGGGGGAGGMCLILYNTLTAGTGTINTVGGTGGIGGAGGGAGNMGTGGSGAGATGAGGLGGPGKTVGGNGSQSGGSGGGGGSDDGTHANGGTPGSSDGGLLTVNTNFA